MDHQLRHEADGDELRAVEESAEGLREHFVKSRGGTGVSRYVAGCGGDTLPGRQYHTDLMVLE